MTNVRQATFAVMRDCAMTKIFSNPGSTEVSFLADLSDDFEFVLALHEGSVVGMATGYAIATRRPAFVNLHTTAGLGNAIGALATARVNRAPLVVVVGQQDRRHLALEPFLAGKLAGLGGEYPVSVDQPALPQDVPSAVRRAYHQADLHKGPAIVIVPLDDWEASSHRGLGLAAAAEVHHGAPDANSAVAQIVTMLDGARAPVLVVGAGTDDQETWDALASLSERLDAPVWQEAFGARAGFPQDHPNFAGHLPKVRSGLREVLADHDLSLVVGTAAFRQFLFEEGDLVPEGLIVIAVSADPDEVHRSHADLAILAEPRSLCAALAATVRKRNARTERVSDADHSPILPPRAGEPLRAAHVYAALGERLPREAVLVEETPSSRQELMRLVPARTPGAFVSAAMGALGFALPAAAGMRMGDPTRPVVAVIGDGSFLFNIQGLWSAAHYGCGVLYVVMTNGGYAIMDRLAERYGGKAPWPSFENVDIQGLAKSFGCPSIKISSYEELLITLDQVVIGLADRTDPIVLDISVEPDPEFEP